ncbi:MAG: EamA family transporter [Hyphomicrobiales bacterium]|nr:EamA family transporter [Hyphomicrobiales bacterium]
MQIFAQPWFLWALGSAGFAALTAVFAKAGVAGIDSSLATFVRTLVVVPLAAFFAWRAGAFASVAIPARAWLFLVLSGLGTGASWLCYFRALQLGEAGRVAPVDKLSLVLVAIFATVFLGETLSWKNWIGIGLVLAGVLLIAMRE